MSFEVGTATGCDDLLDLLDAFLAKGHALSPAYAGTGDGTITELIGTATSVQETITITFTSSTAFGVVGSVTGSMGTGTVGTTFTHAKVTFKLVAGSTPWASSATVIFVMTLPWTQLRGSAGSEYIWSAPGDDGLGEIFVGAKRFNNVPADYDNWRLGGFTGYDGPSTFITQPGFIGLPSPCMALWSSSIPYWFFATGRRVIVVAKVSTGYESCYLGLINAYASPAQWPYPLAVGGSLAWYSTEPALSSTSWRYSYVGTEHRAFPMPEHFSSSPAGQLRLRKADGTWFGFRGAYTTLSPGAVWPYASNDLGAAMADLRPNLDGSYPTFPIVMSEGAVGDLNGLPTVTNVFGDLDGMRATTGHLNASENVITIGRQSWLVVQNVTATTKHDYFAVRMD